MPKNLFFLLVDDDSDDREFFCEAVEELTYKIFCQTASNGVNALEKMDKEEVEIPDVIFLDINMPIMNGWKCLLLLKEREAYKHIPIVMCSTSSYAEDVNKARQLNALCFYSKPYDVKSLKKILKQITEHLIDGSPLQFKL